MKRLIRLFGIIFMMVTVLFFSGCAVTNLPVPEIKEGRFNFSVTYEVDGVEKNYSGVYVCKYDGVYVSCVGEGRQWKAYVENYGEDIFFPIQETDGEVVYIDLGFYPEYFMSDPDGFEEVPEVSLFVHSVDAESGGMFITNDQEEIFAQFGARVISYEYDQPIENSYKNQWSIGDFEFTIN